MRQDRKESQATFTRVKSLIGLALVLRSLVLPGLFSSSSSPSPPPPPLLLLVSASFHPHPSSSSSFLPLIFTLALALLAKNNHHQSSVQLSHFVAPATELTHSYLSLSAFTYHFSSSSSSSSSSMISFSFTLGHEESD